MKECDFKYGEEIEVSDDGKSWGLSYFVCYVPENNFPYFASCRNNVGLATGFKIARRRRPDLKPGQPILVWCRGDDSEYLRFFKCWEKDGVITSQGYWGHYSLLKNYDYSASIDDGI